MRVPPRWPTVFPPGIEDDRGRSAPHAIEIQTKSVYGNELAGLRIKDVAGKAAAARYMLARDGDCRDEHRQQKAAPGLPHCQLLRGCERQPPPSSGLRISA